VIKAIETRYAGYHFRSRLEARWAVFFDSLKIKYRYEPEGFKFDGECYLPDFYLPDLRMFAEVKPDASFDKAIRFSDAYNARKCEEMLADFDDTPLLCLQGPPGENTVKMRGYRQCREVSSPTLYWASPGDDLFPLYTKDYGPPSWVHKRAGRWGDDMYFWLRGHDTDTPNLSVTRTAVPLKWDKLPINTQAFLAAEISGALSDTGLRSGFDPHVTPVYQVLGQSDRYVTVTITGLEAFEYSYTWVAKATDVTAAIWRSRSARFD